MSRNRHGRGSPPPHAEAHREKAMRSIFVANIAFETTEDQMRAVLSEVSNEWEELLPLMHYYFIYFNTGRSCPLTKANSRPCLWKAKRIRFL